MKPLEDATDPRAIALTANKHIKLDKLYVLKKDQAKVWKLVALTDTMANLVHKPFFGPESRPKATAKHHHLQSSMILPC